MFIKNKVIRRKILLGLNLCLITAMIVLAGTGIVRASERPEVNQNTYVDPLVYIALEQEGSAEVLVILKEQADLSGAGSFESKAEKGSFVYNQLTSIARQTQGPMQSFLETKGADYRSYWIQNMFKVIVDTKLLLEISAQPGIDRIEMYHQPYLDIYASNLGGQYGEEFGPLPIDSAQVSSKYVDINSQFGPFPADAPEAIEWNILRVNADDVWGLGITGAGAVVGDLDTGVQWNHPALINQYRGNAGGGNYDHNYNWWDGLSGAQVPLDYGSHGTHTMGTIIGDDGGANQIGMAPGAKWIACPGIGSPYVGPFECFEFFLAPTDLNGQNPMPALAPHVISNSWSSAGTNYHPAIQALYAAGIYFSKSAGNTGPSCSTITNPGQWPEVTATAAFANGDTIASFSSRGPVYFGHDVVVKPDIAAPGVAVRSSVPGNGYASNQGTSMACPHVTGAVALLISANPALAGRIDILQMLLKQYAQPIISAQCGPYVDHPNDVWGWGILNIYDAVLVAQSISIGTLQGYVLDSATMLPVGNALVRITDATTLWEFSTSSDDTGFYTLDIPAATYNLAASQYGYMDGLVSNVVVTGGMTTEQDILLNASPLWVVSGAITDSLSGDPLAATVSFDKTPVRTATDPETGLYSVDVAEGTWWMDVKSPGHTAESLQLTVDQDKVVNFSLEPIENYYMHRSVEGACGPVFNWMDAVTGGTTHPLSDDSNTIVSLPAGRSFDFYGATYNYIFIGSNGHVTFGAGDSKWSGPIPDPATPNNGIYAFDTDLNPASGGQGNIYSKYIDNRYFVIEWYQVQHYPSGNPETFEIILDLDTNHITIQYLVVSDTSNVVSGVENSNGTEATQYAYNDPELISNNKAVTFYPQFGTPPPTGGEGELAGTVTDGESGLPIQAAHVFAESYSNGTVFTFTTDVNGMYTAPLCADWYDTSAAADGYTPVVNVEVSVISGTLTTQDFILQPACDACTNVEFTWLPQTIKQGEVVTFTASASGTLPISYTWNFGDGSNGSGQSVSHIFSDAGTYSVTLTANNCAGVPVEVTHQVAVQPLIQKLFLPLTLR